MTTHPPLHRLRRRYLIASVTVLLASAVEFALSRFPTPVFYLAAVPIVVVVVCTVVLTRTSAQMERHTSRVRWTSIERGTVPRRTDPNECTVCGAWHGNGVISPCHDCYRAELDAEKAAQAALRAAHYGR